MVRSDGNGSYVIDKNLWKAMLAIIAILLAITGVWGQSILGNLADVQKSVHSNEILDARQDEQIRAWGDYMSRLEKKLDEALKSK